ncbi:MAG: amidohydrolase/deacetylase family metallohydrolase [Bacteroidetes bacterium]|nr:amidohydrolase/deacetylase family metallohydrolase [Bacteroidota bacterium]
MIKSAYQTLLVVLVLVAGSLVAQNADIVIRNGHVIDAKNNINSVMDVAITDGKISQVGPKLSVNAKKTIDATGLYVVPGLIDLHGHHYYGTEPDHYLSDGYSALPPDGFTFRAGVTAVVDAGGSGWRNFTDFRDQTFLNSKTKMFAFLNIVGAGMRGGAYEQNTTDMDSKLTALVAKQYPDQIVGIKLAHFMSSDWTPTDRAVEAGRQAGIPVMIDFGAANPVLSWDTLLLKKLRPGDIVTHCFGQTDGRMHVVENGTVQPYAFKAQQRGIIFDVGHGGGSFMYSQAIPAIKQGLKPNTISTDLHTGSMNGGMKDMANVMSKLLNIGLSLQEVIAKSTWEPAKVINKKDLGNLSPGAPADVALFSVDTGKFGFIDVGNNKMTGDKKLTCHLTLLNGEVVWDLNGLAANPYKP